MKKVSISIAAMILLVSCSKSPEQKAKDLIKDDLKGAMNDFNSYEPVEFGRLDSNISSLDTSIFETELTSTVNYQKTLLNDMEGEISDKDMYVIDKKYFDSCSNVVTKIKKEKDNYLSTFKPEFKGWLMTHKFRGNNKMGAKVHNEYVYYFDKDVTKVVGSDNLDK